MSTDTAQRIAHHHHIYPGAPEVDEQTKYFERLAPYGGEVVARVTLGTRADALAAIAVARKEFDEGGWPRLSGSDRARILLRWSRAIQEHGEEIAQLEVREVGKPISNARGEIGAIVELIERAAYAGSGLNGESYDDMGGKDTAVVWREPVGVVGAIIPWNFPGLLYAQKVPYALAAGNTVVVKPSEFTSGSAVLMTRLAYEVGIPETALTLVTGLGPDVGQPLAESTSVDMLTFTGSTLTAARLATVARPYPQRQHFELGGKGATIVFPDADLDAAVAGALLGFTVNQGETCSAPTRLLVHQDIQREFVDRLAKAAAALVVGDPGDESTQIGPLIHEQHLAKVSARIDQALADGAVLSSEPTSPELRERGFIVPTILESVREDTALFQEEVFGPVLATTSFATVDEAVRLANATSYGLANSVWTGDVALALRLARRIKSGMVWINDVHADRALLPFGGTRASGNGLEKSVHGVLQFTQLKTVTIRL